jgi:putative transposase
VTKPNSEEETVAVTNMDPPTWLRKQVSEAGLDLLREMVRAFAEGLTDPEADALCGAAYGERHSERLNRCTGYSERPSDTRAGTIALPVPKLRSRRDPGRGARSPRRRPEACCSIVDSRHVLI